MLRDFREFEVCLCRKLFEHYDTLIAYFPPVTVISVHFLPDEAGGYPEYIAQGESVEFFHFLRSDKQVVCDFVADEDLAVPVMDDAAGGVDGLVDH